MDDRLEEIKDRYLGNGQVRYVKEEDMAWLVRQVELQHTQLTTLEARSGITPGMVSEIEDAHRALTDLGVLDNGKELLAERVKRIDGSEWVPVGEALTVLYEMWCKVGLQDTETIAAMAELLTAYDEWLG